MVVVTAPEIPNTGRILDYWLGGTHHYPADAGAASAFDNFYGDFPRVFSTLRAFIGRAVRAVAEQGIGQFLVIGSGIPTRGNVHEAVPGAHVLYTDLDRENIRLGKEILASVPNVDYAFCDARDFSSLDRQAVTAILDPGRPLGVVVVGVNVFLDDSTVQKTLADIHEWAAPGSYLVADFDGEALESYPPILDILIQAGEPLNLRRPEQIRPLLGPWELSEEGIQPVQVWRNPEESAFDAVFMYGCLCRKA
jgi:O-methyltransferase involved in polyketide biosynthesis